VDKLEALKLIVGEAGRGELIFPTNMAASLKLQQALDDPDCHLDAAADLVLAEPLIAARLVSIGNSVAYTRFGGKVSNVRAAVSLLGFNTLRALVTAIVVRQLSNAIADASLRDKANLLWRHSANVAALAKVIARELTEVDPETALFAGIVHEIGGFYLLFRAQEFPTLLDASPDAESTEASRLLARGILQVLKIPKPLISAVASLSAGVAGSPPVSLGELLCLANDLAAFPSPLTGSDSAAHWHATASGGAPFGDKNLGTILVEFAKEIDAMTEALL
jgi:HD-like signal output (HDOD) protein